VVPHAMRQVCYQPVETALQWFVVTKLNVPKQARQALKDVMVREQLSNYHNLPNPTKQCASWRKRTIRLSNVYRKS